ncbi:MAG: molybdopterin-binding protein [Tissierellia bacterium]|jgi:molybdenum cofactor synthesis domain-containing protein|nr:molybdopterin-binding protein [Tissierellia bacterium]
MIRRIKVEDAIGEPLLHDITGILENGFKGVMFKRNHIIQEEDIEILKNIGKDHIYVGELEENEVHEEDAIMELIPEILGNNIEYSSPSEGKTSLTSKIDGLFVIDGEGLKELNSIGSYTLATIPSYTEVKPGDRLVGARIIPLFIDRSEVEVAKSVGNNFFPVFEVKEFRKLKVGTIITGDEVYYGRIKDRFEDVLRKKLEKYNPEILGFIKCPDDLEKIKEAFDGFMEQGADLVIFTGGMSVDPDDLTPTAMRESGAQIITQGVPMQPGNMLTVGKLEDTYLVGVPGASIHAPVTSLEVFLPRIFAGLELEKADFVEVGEGGLCMNCKVCHYPICYFGA